MPAIVESALSKRIFSPTDHPDIFRDQNGQQCIDVSKITIPPHRVRTDYKNIDELRDTILKVGLIQPIKLQRTGESFILAAGGRRTRAFLMTGERYIPFTYESEDDVWAKEVEMIENLIREPLDWTEQCKARAQLHALMQTKYGAAWNQEKTGAMVGESQKTISTKVKMGAKFLKDPKLAETIKHLPMSAALKNLSRSAANRQAHLDIASGAMLVNASIIHCDAFAGVSNLPSESVHLWCTDPPFGDPAIEMDKSRKTNMIYTGTLQPEDNLDFASYRSLMSELVPAVGRTLVPGAHFYIFFSFSHYNFLYELLKANQFIVEEDPLIWYKNRTSTSASGYNYPRSYEPIMFGYYKEKTRRLSGENLRDLIECQSVSINDRLHNFQKPTKLLIQLIGNSTIVGETVLDTFAGSGAIIKAAQLLQRNGIGFEVNQHNYLSSQLNLKPVTL